jgi:hypothetical protein
MTPAIVVPVLLVAGLFLGVTCRGGLVSPVARRRRAEAWKALVGELRSGRIAGDPDIPDNQG